MVSRDFGVKAMRRLRAPFCFIVLGFALLGVLPTLAGIANLREDVALSPQGGQAAPVDPAPPAAASHPPARLLPPPPALQAASAVLLDLETGRLLYTQKAHERRPPGGLAKIATALAVLHRGGLDENVRIGRSPVAAPGYGLRFEEGEEFALRDLVAAMMFLPGNDAAVAVAEHVAGSATAFAGQMDAAARASGAVQSAFRSPHGLDEPGQFTTAFDLALIAKEALGIPELAELVSRRRTVLSWRGRERDLRNFNSFLWRFPGAWGVLSSYTPESGYSLIAAAQRSDSNLLAVVLSSPSAAARWLDVASLLEYGFANYPALLQAPLVEKVPYEVRAGDTLTGLARRFDVPIAAIRQLNGLEDPDRLPAGTVLWIPR